MAVIRIPYLKVSTFFRLSVGLGSGTIYAAVDAAIRKVKYVHDIEYNEKTVVAYFEATCSGQREKAVMNAEEEIEQAFADYRAGRF